MGTVCAHQQAAGGGPGVRSLLVVNAPTLAFNRQNSSRFCRKQQTASSLDGLLDDALIEPVSAYRTGAGLSRDAHGDGGPVWSVDGGAIDVLQHVCWSPT